MSDRLQPGIYFQGGARPPACLRLLFVDIADGVEPQQAKAALDEIWAMLADLKRGHVRELAGQSERETKITAERFADLDVLLGYGRRLFDAECHQPPLTRAPRPPFLSYLPPAGQPFPEIDWHADSERAGESDLVFQFTAPADDAVNRAAVEIWKLIAERELALVPKRLYAGFGRGDGRGWLEFHDGVANLRAEERRRAITARGDPSWIDGGTYLAFLRFVVELGEWRLLGRAEQELVIGRDKLSGSPLTGVRRSAGEVEPVAAPAHEEAPEHRDPAQTTDPAIEASHVHRANQNRASASAPAGLRIFRQGYDFLDDLGPAGPRLGLNFISFQADLETLQHLLHLPGWLGDVNFGGRREPEPGEPAAPKLISLDAGGLYAVPPRAEPFPGAVLFERAQSG